MTIDFDVSGRLIFWGDNMDPLILAKVLQLGKTFYKANFKGDLIPIPSTGDNSRTRTAKTGILSCSYDRYVPESKRNPDAQFEFFMNALKNIDVGYDVGYKVERAEFQMFLSSDHSGGNNVEFHVPRKFIGQLVQLNINFSISVF